MNLNELIKVKGKTKKRIGRGIGSGKGKTGGKGSKGQKVRGKIPASFVGGGLPLYKKLPFRRGLGNRKVSEKKLIVKTSQLNTLKAGAVVNITSLVESGIIKEKQAKVRGVKILADEEVKLALTVELPVSAKVRENIERVGGKVV